MGKDPHLIASNQLSKAEKLYKARQYKKAGKTFGLAAHSYTQLEDFNVAKNCHINAANCFMEIEKYKEYMKHMRSAAGALLIMEDYINAHQLYREALEHASRLRSSGDQQTIYLLFSTLSYLCLFTKSRQEEGLNFLKKIQKKIDSSYFKEHGLVQLVTNLTIALRDHNRKFFERALNSIEHHDFTAYEKDLTKKVFLIVNTLLSLESQVKLDKEQYTTNEKIGLNLQLNSGPLVKIFKDSFYNFDLTEFQISKVSVHLTDNFTSSKKPELPMILNLGTLHNLDFIIKPHFQLENPLIGPLDLTCELNSNLVFVYTTSSIKPNLTSPPASLDVSIKNLRPPLLDQTFPLEILVENKSEGDASDIKIEVEFPDQLRVMRGTTLKQIYSLRINEKMDWEINLKPIEAGDYIIKIKLNFTDQDQNTMEMIKEFPFSITL